MKRLFQNIRHQLTQNTAALAQLFYPDLCLACKKHLPASQLGICLSCLYRLPKTGFHEIVDNPLCERLWGRIPLKQGSAFLYYSQGGRVQSLIHHLKYYNRPEVAYFIGRIYGKILAECSIYQNPDVILPVPLHPRKLHSRGYNQAAHFARGLGESLACPVEEKYLYRTIYSDSQTSKSRAERMENVLQAFKGRHTQDLAHQHVLIVDDVFTTGATLEGCAIPLMEIPEIQISVATIAIGEY